MKPHYSEADLLETYYTQPGESLPVMLHLADCSDCAARYEGLDRKLRESAACETTKPDGFWAAQRIAIVHRVGAESRRPRRFRLAAAAALVVILGGSLTYRARAPHPPDARPATATVPASVTAAAETQPLAHDVWQSDELKDFHSVVDWESWVQQPQKGDQL